MADYDLIVIGAPPGGVACAVRAAREGLKVLLTTHTPILGGMIANGLSVWDTIHEGKRSPVYDELRQSIFDYYREKYGEDSEDYRNALPGERGHTNGRYEAHVAEKKVEELVRRESRITVERNVYPEAVEIADGRIVGLTLKSRADGATSKVSGDYYADCTYEGDLAAVAGVPYRLGRESAEEFGEPHAGHIFMRKLPDKPESEKTPEEKRSERIRNSLNLRKFDGKYEILPESTLEADHRVQAYNMRTVLSKDPENRIKHEAPPPGYDEEWMKKLEPISMIGPLPNKKWGWNRPQLLETQHTYAESGWEAREETIARHYDATVQMLYFLQNDPSVSDELKNRWKEYGFAKDEFVNNNHRPYEIYVREARRIVGRDIVTEHDCMLCKEIERAPIKTGSIAISDWYMDAHACDYETVEGSTHEGKVVLLEETFPGQISYDCFLPETVENLIVPGCLSSTHVAWGAVRLEPAWMHYGESAAFAAVMAREGSGSFASVEVNRLQCRLADNRVMLTFFNDVDVAAPDSWVPAVQFWGTKGFFQSYDARPNDPLDEGTADAWIGGYKALQDGSLNSMALATSMPALGEGGRTVDREGFKERLVGVSPAESVEAVFDVGDVTAGGAISRAEAAQVLYELMRS